MNILVTGGAGYIGSLAVKKLVNNGHKVTIIDDLSTGSMEALTNVDCDFKKVDIRCQQDVEAVFAATKFDLVMDFAAKLIVEESVSKPEEYYDVNVNGLKVVLDAMVKYDVKKIIFSSTAAVYGLLDKKDQLINEEDPTVPCNPYGSTKLIGEFMIKDYANAYGIEFVIFRYFNVVGGVKYGAKLEDITTVVPRIIDAIDKSVPFGVFGDDYNTPDGSCVRDFIHLEDLVNAHIIAAEQMEAKHSGVYHLSIGKGTSVLELVKHTEEALGLNVAYKIMDRRPGDPVVSAATNQKFCNTFKWDIQYTNIGEMIAETYKSWMEYMK